MKKNILVLSALILISIAAYLWLLPEAAPAPQVAEQPATTIPQIEVPTPAVIEEDFEPDHQNSAYEIIVEEKVVGDNTIGDMTDEDIHARVKIGLTEESIERLMQEQQGLYHFDRLDLSEQRIYVEILTIMQEYGSGIVISSMEPDNIEKVFQCVLNDHPGIFYVVGYRYTKYSLEDVTKKVTFTATYNVSLAEMQSRQRRIDSYVEACLRGMPVGADDYEKVKYIYEYLINHTEYDAMAPDNQNICSVFLGGRSVCQGYAKATQYLLNMVGIPTTMVMGRVIGGEGHAWNMALIDGEYYFVDTTFGDASYQIEGNSSTANNWGNSVWPINYDYLNVTTDQIEKTHIIEEIVTLPRLTATKNNYYIREGLFFISVDEDKLQALFNREYERGSQYMTLKCSNIQIYREMMNFLIEQQNVFKYLQNNEGQVRYADMEDQLSISFWLY
jgi:transglutaminase-like putative cysteine protease